MKIRDLLFEVDVNSAEFKQWFGNSKVVDEKGKPLMCFHGTHKMQQIDPGGHRHFGTFDAANERIRHLFNFGMESVDSIEDMIKKGWITNPHVYPVYLKIENPVLLEDENSWTDADVIPQLY
jgi:hypothetical protein